MLLEGQGSVEQTTGERKMAKVEYKTVVVRDLKSLRYAELLKRHGWIVGSVGTETVLFYRKQA